MKIKFNKYAIIPKEKPISFIDDSYDTTDDIEDAMLSDSEEITKGILKNFDTPEEYEILHIKVTYEM